MTALGFLYPGHSADDDYPRIEQLLGSDIRVELVHTDLGEETHRLDAQGADSAARLAAEVQELRHAGADAVVWASTSGGFVQGWDGAQDQVRTLAQAAGLPASSTSFGFAHAVRELGVRRVAIGAAYPEDLAQLFAQFLRSDGVDVVSVHGSGGTAAAGAGWGEAELLALARDCDHPEAEALLLPGTDLHTAAHIPALEKEVGKPVLTANQVTVWEALRLADRRVNAPELGALFTREPIVQA
ncbi:maleate cis-trans isomerase family protein [Streptomyces djakartensis]|jgi:maleate cis-trans isomerase|uniref:maleate cis-trans isomerase family protein n=1 Tax=Streptomyces djakartensis TaxID=68193 RepID=UPI0034DF144D